MRVPNELKRAALAEFHRGGNWNRFVTDHGHEIKQTEPHDVSRYRTLRGKLLHLVVSGEAAGQYGCGDDDALPQWEADDDTPVVDAVVTAARFNAAAAGLPLTQGMMFDQAEATP